jgi:hypothetical protein
LTRSRRLRALFLLLALFVAGPQSAPASWTGAPDHGSGVSLLEDGRAAPLQMVRESAGVTAVSRLAADGTAWPDGRLGGSSAGSHARHVGPAHARIRALTLTRLRPGTALPGAVRGRATLHTTTLPPPTAA